MDPSKNRDIAARRLFKPPFSYDAGYITDAEGNMLADEGGTRIRGWGRIGAMENGADLQDAVGERVAKILTENWNK